jgi:hypothetical protein
VVAAARRVSFAIWLQRPATRLHSVAAEHGGEVLAEHRQRRKRWRPILIEQRFIFKRFLALADAFSSSCGDASSPR